MQEIKVISATYSLSLMVYVVAVESRATLVAHLVPSQAGVNPPAKLTGL